MPGMYLYAELLIHIRQLTLYGSLSQSETKNGGVPVNGVGTKLLLAPNKKTILAVHEGEVARIYLPCKVNGTMGVKFATAAAAATAAAVENQWEFSARLTLGEEDTSKLEKVVSAREEGIEAPWSAVDLQSGCEVSCKQCGQVVLEENRVKEWKDLPSEHWADLMDLWFCHKPHGDGEDEAGDKKGFGTKSRLRLSQGIGLVDVLSLVLHQEDCRNIIKGSSTNSTASDLLLCEKCNSFLGTVSADGGQDGCRLFKSSISVQDQSYELAVLIGAQLLHLIPNSISRRVVIHASTAMKPAEGILAWVFIPDIYYASSQSSPSKPCFIRAMKVLYKVIDNPLELVDAPTSTVEELVLPQVAYAEFKASIEASAKILPGSARRFKLGSDEWKVGLVERWEKTPSGRKMVEGNEKENIQTLTTDIDVEAKGWKDLL